jgi:DNA-directed RNA polymerase specialized sigma24 family protein
MDLEKLSAPIARLAWRLSVDGWPGLEADDLKQEAMLKAWQVLGAGGDPRMALVAARNELLSIRRKAFAEKRGAGVESVPVESVEQNLQIEPFLSLWIKLALEEARHLLPAFEARVLAELAAPSDEVERIAQIRGGSTDDPEEVLLVDIATVLGVSKHRVSRALARIRLTLQQQGINCP